MGQILATYPSSSNPNVSYNIIKGADGVIYCSCPGWKMRKMCKHLVAYGSPSQSPTILPAISANKTTKPSKFKFEDFASSTKSIQADVFASDDFQSLPWYQGCGGEIEGDIDALKTFLREAEVKGWPAEPKRDGINITCFSDGKTNRFWSRNSKEKAYGLSDFPLPAGTILIGELGFGSEHALIRRAQYNFDFMDVYGILCEDYKLLTHLSDNDSRSRLEQFMGKLSAELQKRFILNPRFTKHLVDEFDLQHEGLVVKKPSTYRGGGVKIPEWIKVKKWTTTEMVVMDMKLSNATSKSGLIESITCGAFVNGKLTPLVKVGSMPSKWQKEFADNFKAYKGKVVELAHFGQFKSGSLRHPSFIRLREDKDQVDCIF